MNAALRELSGYCVSCFRWILTLICCICASQAFSGPAPGSESTLLDEVVVQGVKPSLSILRQQMIEAEERFFARYNELNPIDDFDVVCRVETRTGSKVPRRYCQAVFEESAIREWAREAFKVRQFVHESGGRPTLMPGTPVAQAAVVIEARRPHFQRHMGEMVRDHPELLRLLQERAKAVQAYEAATRSQ